MTLNEAFSDLKDMRICSDANAFDRLAIRPQFERDKLATVVEGSDFKLVEVAEGGITGFTHFLDGAQKVFKGLYWRFSAMPIVHVSAAIVERVGTEVFPPKDHEYAARFILLHPENLPFVDHLKERLNQVDGASNLELVAVRKPQVDETYDEAVSATVADIRNDLEGSVAASFTSGNLLVDGGLDNILHDRTNPPFAIGIVKSHGIRYLGVGDREDSVLAMRVGQRSTVFERPQDKLQGEAVFSFYLRIHEKERTDPWYGVIRVEMPMADQYLTRVDEISGWILRERAPLSLPDPRSDKLLYPIRLVEQHLKARQPGTAAIMGLVG